MTDKCRCDPTFPHPTKCLYTEALRAVLDVVRYVVLDWRRRREIEMLPGKEQEVPEVLNTGIYFSHGCNAFIPYRSLSCRRPRCRHQTRLFQQ